MFLNILFNFILFSSIIKTVSLNGQTNICKFIFLLYIKYQIIQDNSQEF
jgi:hypothetical protein